MGTSTPICEFGWKAVDFTLPDLDGQQCTLSRQLDAEGLLLAFICNHCPYVKAIIDRLVSDVKIMQADGVKVLAIMSNDYDRVPADSPEMMQQFAQDHGMTFPYLLDKNQQVAKAYGAVCTPDFFGFNKHGELQYRGRIDSAGMKNAEQAAIESRTPELLNAMRKIASTGQGPTKQIASIGCSIKWR